MWLQVTAGFLTWASCLPDRGALDPGDPSLAPSALQVHDSAQAPWPVEAMPRLPAFTLTFDAPPGHPEERLWLVRGNASPDVLDDLGDPPLRAATQQALVPLTVHAQGRTVVATPEQPLTPAAHYALVWTRGDEPAIVYTLAVSASPAAGARWVESWPGDRDVRVPPNTTRLLLRFDGYVHGLEPALLSLRELGETPVPFHVALASCERLSLPAGDCATLTLDRPLAKGVTHELALLEGVSDATGAPVPARAITFATGADDDRQPPGLAMIACALDETVLELGCALPQRDGSVLRAASDEPVLVTLSAGLERHATLARSGAFSLALTKLVPGSRTPALLQVEDLAGQITEFPFVLDTPRELATLAIDEVRADPLGPEPAQEYVELLNFGPQPVQIMGFSLTDDAFDEGRSIVTALSVAAGERVLVVAPEFDPADMSDGELPAGVRIARLDGALSLRNEGELLMLRDALGVRLSESPRMAGDVSGQCIARAAEGAAFIADPAGACTPGSATSVELL